MRDFPTPPDSADLASYHDIQQIRAVQSAAIADFQRASNAPPSCPHKSVPCHSAIIGTGRWGYQQRLSNMHRVHHVRRGARMKNTYGWLKKLVGPQLYVVHWVQETVFSFCSSASAVLRCPRVWRKKKKKKKGKRGTTIERRRRWHRLVNRG